MALLTSYSNIKHKVYKKTAYAYFGSSVVAIIIIFLSHILTGKGERLSIAWFLQETSPYLWASLGIILSVSLSVFGAALGIYTTGVSIISGGVRAPRIHAKNLISVIFCEAVAVYGLITSIVLAGMLEMYTPSLANNNPQVYNQNYLSGYLIFGSGIIVGSVGMVSALAIGCIGSGAALADAAKPGLFFRILVVEIFASAFGLFGLIVGMYMTYKVKMGDL